MGWSGCTKLLALLSVSGALALAGLVGCRSASDAELSSLGLSLRIAGGNLKTTQPGSGFAEPLRVLVLDTLGQPVTDVGVTFQELTGTGSMISESSAVSDSDGIAETRVVAANVSDVPVRVEARIEGTESAVVFDLSIQNAQALRKFVVQTTHGGTETAGVAFGLTIQVVNSLDPSQVFTDVDGSMDLPFQLSTASSWTGVAPTGAGGSTLTCVFADGVCATGNIFTLTDSRAAAKLWIGDGAGGIQDVFAQEITVVPGPENGLAIVNAQGGPSQGAAPLGADIRLTTTDAARTYHAARVDASGNYLGDVPASTLWFKTGDSGFTSSIDVASGGASLSVVFTPNQSGAGTLTVQLASGSGTLVGTTDFTVAPDAAVRLKVATQRGNTETAGRPFTLDVTAVDSKDNLVTSFEGSALFTTYNIVTASVKSVSGGCPRFFNYFTMPASDFWGPVTCSGGVPLTHTQNESFIGGRMISSLQAISPYDGISPRITVRVSLPGGASLEGILPQTAVSIAPGTADRIMLYRGSPSAFTCKAFAANNHAVNCFTAPVGTPIVFTAVLEDQGGTNLGSTPVTWTTSGAWAGALTVSNPSATATLTPTASGSGSITVSGSGITTTYFGTTP